MDRFKIFPSIGIARLGGSADKFFLCPETENSHGLEIDGSGVEQEVRNYKDSQGLIKKQGARFRIFELNTTTNEYLPIDTSQVKVEWRVHLVNKKAGVQRQGPPTSPPALPLRLRADPAPLIIDSTEQKISGNNQSGIKMQGRFKSTNVELGELKTDRNGNLIVLGGNGKAESVPAGSPIQNFYFSSNWYDDAADGPVSATLTLADGTIIQDLNAWVIVGPPDFAPNVKGVVTLYDIMQDTLTAAANRPQTPSFKNHILPIIERYRSYKWVSNVLLFSIPNQNSELADTAASNQGLRSDVMDEILRIESPTLDRFFLTDYQHHILERWVEGSFVNDLNGPPPDFSGDTLTKAVLDTTVGQGFFPGIEGGLITRNPNIYSELFRFDHSKVQPGDITALMALPWQADFLKCQGNWWPSQRPDTIKLANGNNALWQRGIGSHVDLIQNFNKLGFIKPSGQQQVEQERTL